MVCLSFLILPSKPLESRVGRSYATDAVALKMDKFWHVKRMKIMVNHWQKVQPEDSPVYHKVF